MISFARRTCTHPEWGGSAWSVLVLAEGRLMTNGRHCLARGKPHSLSLLGSAKRGNGWARQLPLLAERARRIHRIFRKAVLVQARSWKQPSPPLRKDDKLACKNAVLHPSQVAVYGHTPSARHRNDESGAPLGHGASRVNDCKAIGGWAGEERAEGGWVRRYARLD